VGDRLSCKSLRRATTEDADPWVRSLAVWSLGQLGDSPSSQLLRPLLASTASYVRRAAVVVLSSLGDGYARRLLRRQGLAADAAPVRRDWCRTLAIAQPGALDCYLLSRYGDGIDPWLDPRAVIDAQRVQRMARLVRLDPADVRDRYTRLAKIMPLRLAPP
jgi:hypothetical protein